MTYEQKLYSMKQIDLIKEADNKGVEVICNSARTTLKEDRYDVVNRLLAVNNENLVDYYNERIETAMEIIMHENNVDFSQIPVAEEVKEEVKEEIKEEKKETNIPKRGKKIEYNGKSQNLIAWSKELGISSNTLYNRLYKLGWSIERAFGDVKAEK